MGAEDGEREWYRDDKRKEKTQVVIFSNPRIQCVSQRGLSFVQGNTKDSTFSSSPLPSFFLLARSLSILRFASVLLLVGFSLFDHNKFGTFLPPLLFCVLIEGKETESETEKQQVRQSGAKFTDQAFH